MKSLLHFDLKKKKKKGNFKKFSRGYIESSAPIQKCFSRTALKHLNLKSTSNCRLNDLS